MPNISNTKIIDKLITEENSVRFANLSILTTSKEILELTENNFEDEYDILISTCNYLINCIVWLEGYYKYRCIYLIDKLKLPVDRLSDKINTKLKFGDITRFVEYEISYGRLTYLALILGISPNYNCLLTISIQR
jgi:hypothetical protein